MAMPWGRARRIAVTAAAARPDAVVALRDAVGLVLAGSLVTRTPLPPWDEAMADGWAVAGPGPWIVEEAHGSRVPDGAAWPVRTSAPLPAATDAVVGSDVGLLRHGSDATWLYIRDPLTGSPAQRSGYISPGSDVRSRGTHSAADAVLLDPGAVITPAVVSLAAVCGSDEIVVVRPPDVVVVSLGDERLVRGPARDGRVRDTLGPALPSIVSRAGGRALPGVDVPGLVGTSGGLLAATIDDIAADLVLVTGPAGIAGRDECRAATANLDAEVLVDDVAMYPGAETFLARLPDGRLVAYVPGDPIAAAASLVTVVMPVLGAMAGRPDPQPRSALSDNMVSGGYGDDTVLVLGQLRRGELADSVTVLDPTPVALGGADVVVVVPPGGAEPGALLEILDPP